MQPRVTAILVVRNGEEWLDRTLPALAAQTRRPDDFVLVDAASSDGSAARLTAASPTRFVTAPAGSSFGAAVAHGYASLGPAESDDEWLWLLDAATAPEPRALERLLAAVEVAPSVAIAGPKLVDPEDRAVLLSYGESISRYGETVRLVEGELDQAQYDSDGDVLGVSSQAMLVRRNLWTTLSGFDPGLPSTDSGLDFSIRTRLAGARVVRVPDARVARLASPEDFGRRRPANDSVRHRLGRSAQLHRRMTYAPGGALLFLWLGLVPLAVIRSIGHLLGKRPGIIGAELASGFIAAFDGSVGRARSRLARIRRIPWAAIAPLRVPSDELRERRAADREKRSGADEAELVRASFFGGGGAWIVLVAAVTGIAVFWSLLQAQVLRGGAVLPIGTDIGRLWAQLAIGPREGAVDLVGPADPFTAVVAALGSLTAWNSSFSLVLLWLAALPLAALGAWWCATRVSERRWPPIVAALLWMLAPPLLSALSDGRPAAVLVHLVLPWLVLAGIESRRSWSAAATASILFAVVVASSPIMAPVMAALVVVWAIANPRGIVRIVGILIPAAALAAPLAFWQITHGSPLSLLADPGPAVPYAPPSGWLLLLGHPSLADDRWAGIGTALGLPLATLAPAVLLAPVAVFALLAVFLPGARRAIPALAVALCGLVTAVVGTHLQLASAGSEAVTPWVGGALSLYWLGLVGAAVVGVDAIAPAGILTGSIAVVAAIIAVVPLLAVPLLGTGAVTGAASQRLLPALVQAEADADPGIGTLVLTAQADGSLRATLMRDTGTTLDETSTLVSTRSSVRPEDADLVELAGNLASRSGYDPEPVLQDLRIAFIVVPEVPSGATGPQASVRQRTAEALDATPVLTPTGSTPLWEYEGLKPGGATPYVPSTLGLTIPILQGVVFLIALLLAIPTSRRRRTVRELGPLESDPADTFDEDDDA